MGSNVFERGERVAVYWYDGRFTGRVADKSNLGSTGFRYYVEFDSGVAKWVHHKQCRRLKSKRREWILQGSAKPGPSIVVYGHHALAPGERVYVHEVKRTHAQKTKVTD